MNKAIVVGLMALILLIALTLYLSSFLNKHQSSTQVLTSPVPSPNTDLSNKQTDFPETDDFSFSTDEQARIDDLIKKLPYTSSDFEVIYSPELDHFFIQNKTPGAEQKFKDFLVQNNTIDIYNARPALFISSKDDVLISIQNTKDGYKQARIDFQNNIAQNSEDLSAQDQMQPLADLFDKMMNLKFDSATSQTTASNCTTGGYPFGNRNQILKGTPGVGTHSWTGKFHNWESCNAVDLGAPPGTPLCAIADGTVTRVHFGDPNPAGRSAGISLHLAVSGNEWWYAHLIRLAPGITAGTPVKAGQIIGYTGTASNVDHLHLGVRNGNPMTLLGLK